jgi:hypothetical protein
LDFRKLAGKWRFVKACLYGLYLYGICRFGKRDENADFGVPVLSLVGTKNPVKREGFRDFWHRNTTLLPRVAKAFAKKETFAPNCCDMKPLEKPHGARICKTETFATNEGFLVLKNYSK